MKCPFCRALENKVIDSRLSKDGDIIRRRRECTVCDRRFTTYERVEEVLPMIVKKDGGREAYDRRKLIDGLNKACEKRPVSAEDLEELANRVERTLQEEGTKEVRASVIGETVMRELYTLDKVAYVRFASVYRSFGDLEDFVQELKGAIGRGARPKRKPATKRAARKPRAKS